MSENIVTYLLRIGILSTAAFLVLWSLVLMFSSTLKGVRKLAFAFAPFLLIMVWCAAMYPFGQAKGDRAPSMLIAFLVYLNIPGCFIATDLIISRLQAAWFIKLPIYILILAVLFFVQGYLTGTILIPLFPNAGTG